MATTTAPQAVNEPPPVRPDGPRWHSGSAFFWGIVLILTAGILAWLFIGYFGTSTFEDLDQKRVKERQEILKKRNEEDYKLLNEPPSYLDKEKGKIRVPLADAMKLAMTDLQKSKPRTAYPATGEHAPQPAAAPASPDKEPPHQRMATSTRLPPTRPSTRHHPPRLRNRPRHPSRRGRPRPRRPRADPARLALRLLRKLVRLRPAPRPQRRLQPLPIMR